MDYISIIKGIMLKCLMLKDSSSFVVQLSDQNTPSEMVLGQRGKGKEEDRQRDRLFCAN